MPKSGSDVSLSWLASKAVFGGLKPGGLKLVRHYLKEALFPPGKVVVWEGDLGDKMYLIRSGQIEVLKTVRGRSLKRLALLGRGTAFGEMSLLDMHPRSAMVRATKTTRTLTLSSVDLHQIYKKDREAFIMIVMNLGREVCRRLRKMNEQFAEFGF